MHMVWKKIKRTMKQLCAVLPFGYLVIHCHLVNVKIKNV